MNIKKNLLVAATMMMCLSMSANTINADAARSMACEFMKSHQLVTPGTLKAPALADLTLAYAEKSLSKNGAHDYYAFNIKGGGWVIMAGEDRAAKVLGYNNSGQLDFNHLPENTKALLTGYQEEIEYLFNHPEVKTSPAVRATINTSVEPLIQSLWGQEMPYYLQCPIYHDEYCVVGCVATAMSQVMHYWQYPLNSPQLNSYYCYDIGQTIPSLPATNFEYKKMLLSYCHWDWNLGQLIQDTYTDEQAQAVAKLARYCGQAVRMGYSPEGSGAYVSNQLSAMKTFGYSSNARDVSRYSIWYQNYTTAEWEAMIREELDAGRPILYSADDPDAGGHAFVCDGYDTNGMFHFNFGWYGTCNGWYVSTALNMTHRDGDYLRFNSGHEMLLGVVPPEYCLINTSLAASSEMLVLDDMLNVQALDLDCKMSYELINFVFSLTDARGNRVCSSPTIVLNAANNEKGITLESAITLPSNLAPGAYELRMYRYSTSPGRPVEVACGSGKLQVVEHVAKYGEPFMVDDVTKLIAYVLNSEKPYVSISDVTAVIRHILDN